MGEGEGQESVPNVLAMKNAGMQGECFLSQLEEGIIFLTREPHQKLDLYSTQEPKRVWSKVALLISFLSHPACISMHFCCYGINGLWYVESWRTALNFTEPNYIWPFKSATAWWWWNTALWTKKQSSRHTLSAAAKFILHWGMTFLSRIKKGIAKGELHSLI